jgi:hypothetical protein
MWHNGLDEGREPINQKEVRQILCIPLYPEPLSNLYSHYFEICGMGGALFTLLSLYDYSTVETDFVYRTLVFFSHRMDARHDADQ